MADFALDLSRMLDKAKGQTELAVRKVMLETFQKVVMKSPVGNPDLWVAKDPKTGEYVDYIGLNGMPEGYVGGRFRANWQVGYGAINTTTTEDTDKSGRSTVSRISGLVAAAPLWGMSIYMTNSLPYAVALEHGHSTQAPVGMVRTTLAEIVAHYGS